MTADTYYDSIQDMMNEDAIHSLYNGMPVMPWQREVLAMAPLPEDIVDPFAAQDADPMQIMGLAYKSLVTWIDEARKANYFTKRFTDLSKLVLKGVNTMGRGLMTLHNRGEDLSQAPMQIGDLISVGSYHLRKSYLGVIQTASSHPEISERLLINQLSWTNMLLRLYKTKEKLAIPNEEVRRKNEELSGRDKALDIRNADDASNEEVRSLQNEEGRRKNEELSDGKDKNSSFLPLHSSFGEVSSFDELDALFEPAALSAPRALSSLDKGAGKGGRLSPKEELSSGHRAQNPGQETLTYGQGAQTSRKGAQSQHNEDFTPEKTSEIKTPEKPSEYNTKKKPSEAETGIKNEKPAVTDDPQKRNPEAETPGSETTGETNSDEENRTAELREQPSGTPDKMEAEIPDDEPPGIAQPPQSGEDPGSPELPKCLQIIKRVCTGSSGGNLTFTFDEIRFLAADPVFEHLDPKMAAEMRRLSKQIDSG